MTQKPNKQSLSSNNKQYDLEERTYVFARAGRSFVKKLPKTIGNIEDGKQLIRSSGSMASNYIEANESLSKRDFRMRIKICRKEAKESRLWLKNEYIRLYFRKNKVMCYRFLMESVKLAYSNLEFVSPACRQAGISSFGFRNS